MMERILFHLCPGWALAADNQQWMVMRAKNRRGQREWQPVAFVATEKRILRRVLCEKGIKPTPEGRAALDALPDSFKASRPKATTATAPAIRRAA